MKNRKYLSILALVGALMLVAAACGDDDGGETGGTGGTGRGTTTAASRAPSPSEIAVHVKDDVSKWFVIGTVAVFVLILLNGILLGSGGLLRPLPTPTPSASPSASPSAGPSGSASPRTPSRSRRSRSPRSARTTPSSW